MKNPEFKIKKFKDSTVYTLESASSGGTSAGSISSTNSPVGKLQRRNSIIVQDGQELDELKRPSGSMFLKFRVKTLPDDEKTIIAYGGFGTTPADVTVKTAKIKPFDANDTGEVIVRIKKLLADRDFIGVQKIYLDIPNGLKPRLEDLIDYTENDERLELYSAEDHDTDDKTGGGQTAYYVNGKRVSIPGKPQAQVAGSSRGVASTGMVSINATDDGQRLIKALISQNKLSRDTKLVGNKITLRKDDYKKILNTLGNDRFQQYFTKKSEISEKGVGEDHSTMTQGYGRESASTGMAFSNRAKGAIPEEKTRLDQSCWYNKKIGNPKTKVKGGVRVNNCGPKESYQLDEYEIRTFTDQDGNVWEVDDEGNRVLVKGVGGSGTRTGGSRAGRSDDSPYNLKNKTTGKLLLQKGTQSPAVFNGLQHALNVAAKLQFGSWEPVRATKEEGITESTDYDKMDLTNMSDEEIKELAAKIAGGSAMAYSDELAYLMSMRSEQRKSKPPANNTGTQGVAKAADAEPLQTAYSNSRRYKIDLVKTTKGWKVLIYDLYRNKLYDEFETRGTSQQDALRVFNDTVNYTNKHLAEQGVAEGLQQTLRKIVPGYAEREINKRMDAEKFGRTDVDRDTNYYRYKKILDKLKKQGVAENLDQDESVLNHFAEVVADELGYDPEEVMDNIVEEMTTPGGISVYTYTDDDQTYYMGVLGAGKPSALVTTSHAGGGTENELEISIGDQVEYVVKYGAKTPVLTDTKNKPIAQAKPGQDENDLVGIALDMLWGRMQHSFGKGVAEGRDSFHHPYGPGQTGEEERRNRERNWGVEPEDKNVYEIDRYYFKVPFDQREKAKNLWKMRFDPDKKLWYKAKYNTSGSNFDWHLQNIIQAFGEPIGVKKEGWTHDSLADRLFEHERTYEEYLQNLLEIYSVFKQPQKQGMEEGVVEAAKWRDPKYKDILYTQTPGDSDDYDNIGYGYDFPERPKNDPGQKRRMGGVGSEFDNNDPLKKRTGIKHTLNRAGPRKGLPSRDQINRLKGSIKDAHGKHRKPNLPEQGVAEGSDDLETHQNPDPNEYDMEGDFVKNQIHTIVRVMKHLEHAIGDDENLPEWVEEKISQAKGMLVSVMNYMISEKEKQDDLSQSNFDENDQYFETLDQKLNNLISEKALSKSMQRFMGMVHAVQKGDMTAPSPAVAKAAKGMSMKAAHDYAATKHAGLPEKKRASKKK
jgi:hypothetical protein